MNLLIPVVFFCALVPGEPRECNGQTALFKHTLSPVIEENGTEVLITTPLLCIQAGMLDDIKEIQKFQEGHPKEELGFRVICKRTEQDT